MDSLTDGVIVDLSNLAGLLTNYEDISSHLHEDQERKIVDYVKSMLRMSHAKISKRYDHWQEADRAHDVYVPPDATDFREKAVISDTRAVADTVLTYMMSALAGRNPMFQLEGLDRDSRKTGSVLERILHQQMRRGAGEARLAQMMLDNIRYGISPTKIVWDNQNNTNKMINFDPRRTFPDPRITWGDWERMQFCVFVDYASTSALVQSGLYPRLKHDPKLRTRQANPKSGWEAHRWNREEGRGYSIDPTDPLEKENSANGSFTLGDARVVDEAWVRLAGYEIGMPNIEQIWLVMTIVDESHVIRLQLNPYGRQFPINLGGFFLDGHKTFPQGLYDVMLPMHNIATWLMRSRIDNVQAALNNLIFADPTQVSIPDLIDRNPWGVVRTMPGSKPGDGVFIAQVPDVTRGHWNDIQALNELKQRVSAASDAQQGVPTTDVRTATEIQRMTQLGSQRLGILSRIASATIMRPCVRMMVGNIQDAIEVSGSIRMDPYNTPGNLADMINDGYLDYNALDLQGNVDYLVVDGTLPIEPTRSPEVWMNMIQILTNTGLNMEYKVGRIAEEAIRAIGISDLDQFRISEEERQQGMSPSQQMAMMEKMRGASVQPQENVQREVEKGNLIPARQAG
ncbi:portal protein [Kistimonas scapharcae]